MVEDLLDVSNSLNENIQCFGKIKKKKKKDAIAEYFYNIGNLTKESVDILKTGKVPLNKCNEMIDYAEEIHEILDKTIDKEKIQEYQDKLINSQQLEKVMSEIIKNEKKDSQINKLEDIAENFKKLAMSIKQL